jgi:hypothetical protein
VKVRQTFAALLILFFGSVTSWAAICDVSCAVAQISHGCSFGHPNPSAESSAMSGHNMSAGMHHHGSSTHLSEDVTGVTSAVYSHFPDQPSIQGTKCSESICAPLGVRSENKNGEQNSIGKVLVQNLNPSPPSLCDSDSPRLASNAGQVAGAIPQPLPLRI